MNNNERQAGTNAQQSTNAELTTSAPLAANPLLAEVLSNYDFKLLKKERFVELYYLDYDNENNCQGRLLLRVLSNNKTLRLSVMEADDINHYHIVDLFEFKGFGKIHDFMKLVI